jgi:hypothetical protein
MGSFRGRMNQGFVQIARKKSNATNLFKSTTYVQKNIFQNPSRNAKTILTAAHFLCISQHQW